MQGRDEFVCQRRKLELRIAADKSSQHCDSNDYPPVRRRDWRTSISHILNSSLIQLAIGSALIPAGGALLWMQNGYLFIRDFSEFYK